MAPPPPFFFRIWHHWFLLLLLVLSLEIHPCLKIAFSHHFLVSTPRSHMIMMASITRVIWQRVMAPFVSPLSCMSTNAQRTGVLICLILPWIGLISCKKTSYPWSGISHILLFLVIPDSHNLYPVATFVSAVNLHLECPPAPPSRPCQFPPWPENMAQQLLWRKARDWEPWFLPQDHARWISSAMWKRCSQGHSYNVRSLC